PVLQRFLHVLAGAEPAARSGENRHLEAVTVAEFAPGLGEVRAQFVAERVQPLGPVHAHHEDLPVLFGFDDGHVFVSHSWLRTRAEATILALPVKQRRTRGQNRASPLRASEEPWQCLPAILSGSQRRFWPPGSSPEFSPGSSGSAAARSSSRCCSRCSGCSACRKRCACSCASAPRSRSSCRRRCVPTTRIARGGW